MPHRCKLVASREPPTEIWGPHVLSLTMPPPPATLAFAEYEILHLAAAGTGVEWAATPPRPGRTAADFAYPMSSGIPVPAASMDGLCVQCAGAWPCTTCPDLLGH